MTSHARIAELGQYSPEYSRRTAGVLDPLRDGGKDVHAQARSLLAGSDRSVPADNDPSVMLAAWFAEAAGGVGDSQPRLLRLANGQVLPLPVARWAGPVNDDDETLLSRTTGSVLDVGCGPGRLTVALHERGVQVLGLELVEQVPVLARAAGAPLAVGDVFGDVPRAGRWDSVLLADGNVGIGGDPVRLLRRAKELAAPDGRVLCELHPGTDPGVGLVRLESLGRTSAWFRWGLLGRDTVVAASMAAGLRVRETWTSHDRQFAVLAAAARS